MGHTVRRFENGADALGETLSKMQRTLESAGVVFVEPDGLGPGVRLQKRAE
jgi:hypothetical protein